MTPTTVVHVREKIPGAIYIGRRTRSRPRSKWANPYRVGRDGDRNQVIEMYSLYLQAKPDLLAAIGELRGRTLECWCAPEACHGGLLARLADQGGVS